MIIISKIVDFFGIGSSPDFQPTEQEIQEAVEAAEAQADAVVKEEENIETCEICGKSFSGEHAAQKKGGHKASGH